MGYIRVQKKTLIQTFDPNFQRDIQVGAYVRGIDHNHGS